MGNFLPYSYFTQFSQAYSPLLPSQQFGSSVITSFVFYMGKVGESVTILLNIDRVLTGSLLERFSEIPQVDGPVE